jgi:hypothetical protein
MDWTALSAKAKPWLDKTKPLVDKAKTYSSHAVSFVGKQIEATPIFLTTEEAYNIHMSSKRAILIAYDNRDPQSETIRLMMPVWATQAWTDASELKYIEISGNEELARNLKIVGPLEMRISYMGDEYARLHTRCYRRDTETVVQNPEESIQADPLAWVTPAKK